MDIGIEQCLVLFSESLVRTFVALVAVAAFRGWLGYVGSLALASAVSLHLVHSMVESGNLDTVSSSWSVVAHALLPALLGLLFALPVALVLEYLPIAGRVLDAVRGAQIGEMLLPGAGFPESYLERIGRLLSVSLFFLSGGVELWYQAVQRRPTLEFESLRQFAGEVISLSAETLYSGILVASPVFVVLLLLDIFAALYTRTLGRVQIFFEFLPPKLFIGLCIALLLVMRGPLTPSPFILRALKLS